MEYRLCAVVDSDSRAAQFGFLITKRLKYVICNGKLHLCYCRLTLNNSTIRISHRKTPKNTSLEMEYRLCVVVYSDSTTAQIGFSISKHLEISLLL